MIFEKIIPKENIWDKLRITYKNNKIPNGYIFFGNDGVGKEAYSIELAALLNCKRPLSDLHACGTCRSCISIKSFQHEDIHFIHALPGSKNKPSSNGIKIDSKTFEELNNNYKKKIKNPYHKIKLANANTISIASIREIKKKLFLSKSDQNWSVVIIFDAHKLCVPKAEPANALLKILEEPPNKTLFILITSKINLITSTIQSRCQKVFFPNFKGMEIEEYIRKHNDDGMAIDSSSLQLSNGSVSEFMNIIDNDMLEKFQHLIKKIYRKDSNDFESVLSFFNKIKDKDQINSYLNHFIISTKDIYLLSLDKSNTKIHYAFLSETYISILSTFPNGNWIRIIGIINESIQDIHRNINLSLAIYNMLINVQYCLEGNSINTFKSDLIRDL